jgi:hypothetical protein
MCNEHINTQRDYIDFHVGVLFYFKEFSNYKTHLTASTSRKLYNYIQPDFVHYIWVSYNVGLLLLLITYKLK